MTNQHLIFTEYFSWAVWDSAVWISETESHFWHQLKYLPYLLLERLSFNKTTCCKSRIYLIVNVLLTEFFEGFLCTCTLWCCLNNCQIGSASYGELCFFFYTLLIQCTMLQSAVFLNFYVFVHLHLILLTWQKHLLHLWVFPFLGPGHKL